MASKRAEGIGKLREAAALLGNASGDDPVRSALRLVVDGLADVLESGATVPTTRAEALQGEGTRPMLSASDVAAEIGCSKRQAYSIMQLAGVQPIGRLVRISRAVLDGWLEEQTRDGTLGRSKAASEAALIRPVQPRIRQGAEDATPQIRPRRWRVRPTKQQDGR